MTLFLKGKVEFKDSIQPLHIYKNTVIARAGSQKYAESEIEPEGSSTKLVKINRTVEEVARSVKLLDNLPIIDYHPEKDVKFSDDNKILGVVTNARFKDGKIIADLVFYKKPKYNELSVGYSADLIFKDGEYFQTDIKPNHLAVVPSARCGIICSLTKKNKKVENMKITFNDKTHEVTDDVGAYIAMLEANESTSKDRVEKAFKDGVAAQSDRALVAELAGQHDVEFKDSDKIDDVKTAIVKKLGVDTTGQSMAFIDGVLATAKTLGTDEAGGNPQSFKDNKYQEFDYSKLEMGAR